MQIHHLGLQAIQNGQRRALDASQRLVREPRPEHVVDLKLAERDVEVGARLIRAGDRMSGALLDVLA